MDKTAKRKAALAAHKKYLRSRVAFSKLVEKFKKAVDWKKHSQNVTKIVSIKGKK